MKNQPENPPQVAILNVDLTTEFSVIFIGTPQAYKKPKIKLKNTKVQFIGTLSQFNTLKSLSSWRKKDKDLKKVFTDALIDGKWNFENYPNPYAFLVFYKSN